MREFIYRRITLVVCPVDAFTGRVITDKKLEILVDKECSPICKPDGFRVFTHPLKERVTVLLRGTVYQERKMMVQRENLDQAWPVMRIGLLPDRHYAFPADTAYLSGTLPLHAVLFSSGCYAPGNRRLAADADAGAETLQIYQGEADDLTGMVFRMEDRGEGWSEWLEFVSSYGLKAGEYRLKKPLAHCYRKMNTTLFPGQKHASDEMGCTYFAAFNSTAKADTVPVYYTVISDGMEETKKMMLCKGKILQCDF